MLTLRQKDIVNESLVSESARVLGVVLLLMTKSCWQQVYRLICVRWHIFIKLEARAFGKFTLH